MVDVGGGLGVPYHEGEQFLSIATLTEQLNPMFESFRHSHTNTRLFMELGRYLVGTCGMLVSRGSIRQAIVWRALRRNRWWNELPYGGGGHRFLREA